jgi:hypothetical protein
MLKAEGRGDLKRSRFDKLKALKGGIGELMVEIGFYEGRKGC